MVYHKVSASGKWHKLSLAEQLGNIGSEVSRSLRWRGKDQKIFERAIERALELFDLTLDDPRLKERQREIARAREVFCDILFGRGEYHTTLDDLVRYCDQFVYASRLHRDMGKEKVLTSAKKIWDYHHLNQKLEKADVILVLGNPDTRTAEHAAKLFLEGWAPLMVFAGNKGNFTNHWDRPEAEIFAEIAFQRGVPRDKVFIESKSTNTGENFRFSKDLLGRNGIDVQKIMVVCHPLMERRSYATFKKVWPEKEVIVTSPNVSFEECPTEEIPAEKLIHVLVGWLQRIKVWAERGFQIPQEIPDDVWSAYEQLVAAGYTKYLVEE